ncbi:uncharacterized protein [Cicer arietinum]|uniref:Transcriptional regulator SUPERMAN n=1 Tax=Cicer arietinum TaxID=3827 RepID=A0A1S2XXP3_CICAR|nr:transcriptional regulator SUPERMAN [Cicer arietinum]
MEGNYVNRNTSHHENLGFEEHSWGTSWPARNYSCSFCKREFRSAQALGGHMNVHRRDRARLRSSLISSSSSSWNNISDQCPNNNIKPNPTNTTTTSLLLSSPSPLSNDLLMNCSHPSSSSSSLFLTLSSSPSLAPNNPFYEKKPRLTTPSLSLPLLSPQRSEIMMMSKSSRRSTTTLGVEEMKGYEKEVKMNNVFMNNEQNITLELGIGLFKHQQEEKLDLELRL